MKGDEGAESQWQDFLVDSGPLQDEVIAEDQESRVRHDLLVTALDSLNDREKHILMNTLVALGTGSAFLYSVVATVDPGLFARNGIPPAVYYEAVIFIIGFVLAGRAIEARARTRTSDALRRLASLLPSTARVSVGGA